MKKRGLTTSQIVGILALLASIAIPFMIAFLQSQKVHINPLYVGLAVPALTSVAGACGSYLSRFSGTQSGLQFGTDTKALASNAGSIVDLAAKILMRNVRANPADVTAAVNKATILASDLDAPQAANAIVDKTFADNALAGTALADITGQFTGGENGLSPSMPPVSSVDAPTQLQAYQGLPDQPSHSEEPFPLTADPAAEQPPPPAAGSIRELVPDWSDPANAK